MGIAYFQPGALIQLGAVQHVIKREIARNVWQTEEVRSGRLHDYSKEELEGYYADGELVFVDENKPVRKVDTDEQGRIAARPQPTEKLWTKAKMRRAYVKVIEELPATRKLVEIAIAAVWEKIKQPETPPHWNTVLRWKSRYVSNGSDAHALVERHEGKGNRLSRYPDAVIEIVEDVIDSIYMTRERKSVVTTYEHAIVAVDQENQLLPASMRLPLPTQRLVKRIIDALPAFDRHVARYGRTAAIRKFRAKLKNVVTDHRLEVAEIDHTKLDLFVLSDDGAIPLGRPWVTVCIDNHSRCILGIYIGFEPPSFLSVGRCLKHAFLPKTKLKEEYPDIKNAWEAHGVMKRLVVDNGLEFHGMGLEQACYSFGIEIEYTPRKSPWFKGKIERFMRTLNENICYGTPGTTFSNIFEKDDYDPVKHAVVSLSTLRLIIHKWIVDYYHQKPHHGLGGVAPSAMWAGSMGAADIPLPDNPASIDVMLGKPAKAMLTHIGVRVNRLSYNSAELVSFRRDYGDSFEVSLRVDEGNVGHVYVMIPDSTDYIEVPAVNRDYAEGVSLWLHNIYRKFALKTQNKDDPLAWARAKVEIAEIIQRETKKRPKRSNSKLGRYQEATKELPKVSMPQPVIEPLAQLPIYPSTTNHGGQRKKLTVLIEPRGKQS